MAMCLEMAMEAVNRRGVREVVEREMELADVLKMDLSGDSVALVEEQSQLDLEI